jgi:hypothetical protein
MVHSMELESKHLCPILVLFHKMITGNICNHLMDASLQLIFLLLAFPRCISVMTTVLVYRK